MKNLNDDQLIYLARRKDKKAFSILIARYFSFIKNWVKEVKIFSEADNDYYINICIQNIYNILNLYEENKGNFYAFLKLNISSILKKESYKYYKNKKEISFVMDDFDNSYKLLKEPSSNNFNYDLPDNLLVEKIINLRKDGYSYKQIGEKLNLTFKQVDYLIQKFRKNVISR